MVRYVSSVTKALGVAAVVSGMFLTHPQTSLAEDKPAAQDKTTAEAPAGKDGKEVKKKEEKVKTGIIANTGTIGQSGAVSVSTDGSSPGDEPNPISGSVSVAGRGKCIASVTNSGKASYSVRFAVEARNSSGASTLNKAFNATLAPKETVTKDFTCREDDNMQVVLKSATKR